MVAHFLGLLHLHAQLPGRRVVRGAHGKLRRARAVDPLVEEALDARVRGVLDGLDQVRGDHVLQAIRLQVVLERVEKGVVAELFAEHLQHQAGFAVDVSGVVHRIVKNSWVTIGT